MSFVAVSFAGGTGALGAYSSYMGNVAGNESANQAASNASRRYEIKAGIAENQMEEQNQIALEKMTDVARQFLKARGTAKAVQAESMVGGNVAQRIESESRIKESEVKGKVAQEVDTNIINIAQGMLAEKIDTEAMINEALSRKRSGAEILVNTGIEGLSGASSGYQAGTILSK